MIPILYDYSESEWTNNGIGRLSDCISCTVTEERNGIFECEFVYPITGIHYEDILEGRVIGVIHDDTKEIEPFDIYKRSAEIDGKVTFNAHHISYRLNYTILKPFYAPSCAATMDALVPNSINNNPFTFGTDKTVNNNYRINYPRSIREILCGSEGSILDVYGTGEYQFRKYNVFLWTHRGQDTDVEIRYGKNLLDITKELDISCAYNAVAPFWYSEDGELVTLPEEIIISPAVINTNTETWTNESLVTITNENAQDIDFDYAVINAIPMDLSGDFTDVPTVEQLREKATAKLTNSAAWLPDENIKVDFVALWQTEEYKDVAPLQMVSLCDTVKVIFPQLGVNARIKVIKTVYNVLLECYDEMELGDPKSTYAEVITESVETKIKTLASKSFLNASIDRATKLIQGGLGGHVVFNTDENGEPQEILVMDTDDVNTAVNVIRINKNGIGFSNTGYDGTYRTAWTIDGHFVADFIDTGILSADLIKSGTLSSMDDSTWWNLDDGVIETTTADNTRKTRLQAGRVAFYHNNRQTGEVTTALWNNSVNKEGYVMLTDSNFLGFGYGGVQEGTGVSVFVINNGVNPDGRTERMIFRDTVYFRESVRFYNQVHLDATNNIIYVAYIEGSIYPLTDYAGGSLDRVCCGIVPPYGTGNSRFYMVASYMFAFAQGAYLSYADGDASIYSSKTINQASDEHLKNIYPYEDKYDELIEALEPISYTWKDHPDGARYVGLGARKTKTLLEKLGVENSGFVDVHKEEDKEDVYSIDYSELSVMLLHKVQQQEKRIKELENTLSDVLKHLEALEGK